MVSFFHVLFVSYLNILAKVDKTALFLIGAVAGPIAQNLVDGSVLAFSQADISYVTRLLVATHHLTLNVFTEKFQMKASLLL